MVRSLRGRLTLGYLAFVILLFVLVAVVFTREAVQLYTRVANEAISETADQIREIGKSTKPHTFDAVAASVHRTAEKSSVRILGIERADGNPVARPPLGASSAARGVYVKATEVPKSPPGVGTRPLDRRDLGDRVAYSFAGIAGIRPTNVSLDVGEFFVGPNVNRLKSMFGVYMLSLLGLLCVAAVLGWLISSYLARQALAPMVAVTGALQRFADGNFTPQSIDTRDRSEVGDLARAFNGAAQQVTAAFEERQRVEGHIRQFVADASHELRTPLTVIRGYLEVLKRGALNDPVNRDRAFETLDIESRRMRSLIDKLIVLARLERPEAAKPVLIDVASVAREAAEEIRNAPGTPDVRLQLDDGAYVIAEEGEINEALLNLLDNARKYGGGSPIELTVRCNNGRVVAHVIDSGPGIPDDERDHIFERFYRGGARGEIEGSGLGLAIAHQAVARARGSLDLIETRPGRTVFEIQLPAAPQFDTAEPPAELVLG